jgi:hypothetical protein
MIRVLVFLAAIFASTAAFAQGAQVQILCDTGNAAPNQWQPCDTGNTFPVSLSSQYPTGSTAITGNATGTTGAVVGTLAGVAGKTTYICGLNVSATGGTAAIGPITVVNTITGSLVFEMNSSVAGNNISENFSPCIPASAANTAITTTTTADGTASAVAVNNWGFQK